MKKNRLIHSIAYFFLALFLTTELAGLHVLSHDDDKDYPDHCAICHNIAADHQVPAVLSDSHEPLTKIVEFVLQKEIGVDYDAHIPSVTSLNLPFSRPPPTA